MQQASAAFEDIIALEPQHAGLLHALRSLVLSLHPDLVEVVRLGDRAVSWGIGPKKMSEAYACALPYKHHVNLGFYRGVDLPDPGGQLEGNGKAMRHVKITSLEQIHDPALRDLIVAARDERQRQAD
jgi:hypothetical protein